MQPLFDVHKPRGGSKRVPIGVPIGSRTTTAAAHPIVAEDAAFGAHRAAYFGTPAVPLFVRAADPGRQRPRKTLNVSSGYYYGGNVNPLVLPAVSRN